MQFREFRKPELPAHAARGRRRSYEADAFGRLRTGEAAIGPSPRAVYEELKVEVWRRAC